MKSARQQKILEIIENNVIENQSQLLEALKQAGVQSTQATVSRDIKQLRLVKELSPEGYRYVSATQPASAELAPKLKAIFKESVTEFACAQNIVVLKTLPGLASAACSTLDSMRIEGLVGTIAGDDTAFLAMRDNDAAAALCREITALL